MSSSAAKANPSCETLDYDDLLANYQRGLVETLRGFGPAQSYLSLWVPDEVLWKGLWNLFDAAASESQNALRVRVRQREELSLELDALERRLACFGTPSITQRGGYIYLEVPDLRPADAEEAKKILDESSQASEADASIAQRESKSPQIQRQKAQESSCSYRENMLVAAKDCSFEAAPPCAEQWVATDTLLIQTQSELGGLWFTVDSREQKVLACGHYASSGLEPKGCLEIFCALAAGLPIRDVLDHGVARTEFQLRQARANRPVSGIVLPSNAHPLFRELITLTASLRTQCGFFQEDWSESYNEYDPGAQPGWSALDDEARCEKVSSVLASFKARYADTIEVLSLVRIIGKVRVHASLSSKAPSERNATFVSRLEEELRDKLDARLELFLEQKKDQNKLRRLSVIQPKKSK